MEMMDKNAIKKVLKDLAEQIYELEDQERANKERLSMLRASYTHLSNVYAEISDEGPADFYQEPGLTDSIRLVMQSSNKHLTPPEVRDGLLLAGFDLSAYSNVLTSIHTVLRRLVASGEVMPSVKDGKTAYKWKGCDPLTNPKARKTGFRVALNKKRASKGK
jgi:hypothetical protein